MKPWSRLGRSGRQPQLLAAVLLLFATFGPSATATPRAPLIWAFGDSLTAGYGLPPNQGFTAKLQAAARRAGVAASVRNGGVAGDTVAQARARLRWGLRGLGATPDLILVELGANDMLRGLPPAQAKANLDAILSEFDARHIPVLLLGMRAAPNLGPDYVRAFDAMYPALAEAHGVARYPFFLDGVAGHPALIQADGLHPNARGVDIIVGRLLPVVLRALRRDQVGARTGPRHNVQNAHRPSRDDERPAHP